MNRRVSSFEPPQRNRSRAYALRLLDDMASGQRPPEFVESNPAVAWATSGAMSLTGTAEGAPVLAPSGIPVAVEGAFRALCALVEPGRFSALDAPGLLSERAAHFGGRRRGRISAGGNCRLLRSIDGWIAVNLARPDDWGLLAAWFEDQTAQSFGSPFDAVDRMNESVGEHDADGWQFVGQRVAQRRCRELMERGRLLGLPVAIAALEGHSESERRAPSWQQVVATGRSIERRAGTVPRVLDLSSLWAGPLCAHLLASSGAEVIKVESLERPDSARIGAPEFFDLLNAGKRSVGLEIGSEEGRARLRQLIERTDIVIESSRPRALANLGIDAADCVKAQPGLSWISITGYGRGEPEQNWVAFGDDAGVAAGLAAAIADAQGPLFCGDAIADPLTGLHAAVAALGSFRSRRSQLIDLNLCDVAAFALAAGPECPRNATIEVDSSGTYELAVGADRYPVSEPRTRSASGPAEALGASNASVFERLDRRC